jgi:hypothetical protein
MDQTSTQKPKTSLGAKIATYIVALINAWISGYVLFVKIPNSRWAGAEAIFVLLSLWSAAVLIYSVYSLFKSSWVKFFILLAVLALEFGVFIYGLSQAIM